MTTAARAAALAVLFGLAGCATGPKPQAFNRAAHADVREVVVLPMRASEVDLLIANNPGYSFGLIGVAIAEANRVPKRDWLREQVQARGFDHVTRFQQRLNDALVARGFDPAWPHQLISRDSMNVRRDNWGMRKAYPDMSDEGADAQLDVNFGFVGYAAAGAGKDAPYRPTVVVTARLLSADGRDVLLADQVIYNPVFGAHGEAITLQADDVHRYPDFDDLEAAGADVVDGIATAIDDVVSTLADRFGAPVAAQ